MKKWLKTIKNEKGLTLIELLAVVVILGIIAAIAVPSISNIIDNSKKDAHVSNALLIINATKLAVVSDPNYTITATGNKDILLSKLVADGYLDAIPKDPESDTSYVDVSSKVNIAYANNKYTYSIVLKGAKSTVTASEADLNSKDKKLLVKSNTP